MTCMHGGGAPQGRKATFDFGHQHVANFLFFFVEQFG